MGAEGGGGEGDYQFFYHQYDNLEALQLFMWWVCCDMFQVVNLGSRDVLLTKPAAHEYAVVTSYNLLTCSYLFVKHGYQG